MKRFIKGADRGQSMLLPECLDDWIIASQAKAVLGVDKLEAIADRGYFSGEQILHTEVIELPTTCFAEDEGSPTNSGRWLQWHWPGGTPPGEARHDTWIMAQIYLRLKALYVPVSFGQGGRRHGTVWNWETAVPYCARPASIPLSAIECGSCPVGSNAPSSQFPEV